MSDESDIGDLDEVREHLVEILNDPELLEHEIRCFFEDEDKDGSGFIDTEELGNIIERFRHDVKTLQVELPLHLRGTPEEIISKYDDNKNGKLDYEEFQVFLTETYKIIVASFDKVKEKGAGEEGEEAKNNDDDKKDEAGAVNGNSEGEQPRENDA